MGIVAPEAKYLRNPAKIPHKYFAKPTIIRIFAVLKNTRLIRI
jgi:hypothetical protein